MKSWWWKRKELPQLPKADGCSKSILFFQKQNSWGTPIKTLRCLVFSSTFNRKIWGSVPAVYYYWLWMLKKESMHSFLSFTYQSHVWIQRSPLSQLWASSFYGTPSQRQHVSSLQLGWTELFSWTAPSPSVELDPSWLTEYNTHQKQQWW